ncbi:unnamed protein product [Periconia digitata]|uniref:Zn(2)-C6 fungal-type domain-containing protein n=1 Tax=Periconia digitata TaxID=1303443 RepID=A0A9W4XQH3_9PLEO|nr:unnamed protein product [Periconia digitata]
MESGIAAAVAVVRPKRHCWECLRRRLVCDGTHPSCKRCQMSSIDCPGYGHKKPLRWVEPGKKSRKRLSKEKPAPGSSLVNLEQVNKQAQSTRESVSQHQIPRNSMAVAVPNFQPRSDANNSWILPNLQKVDQLTPNAFISNIPLEMVRDMPPAITHALACIALDHRLHQLPETDKPSIGTVTVRDRLLEHRGAALRAISELLGNAKARISDLAVGSILFFMSVDNRVSPSHWRVHYDGVTKLIQLAGGPSRLFRPIPHLQTAILSYIIMGVMGNTTSPAHNLAWPRLHLQHLDSVAVLYEHGFYPTLFCPAELFLAIVRINSLRHEVANHYFIGDSPQVKAEEILWQIQQHNPASWAASVPSGSGLITVSSIHQSAVTIYCVSSLQSLGVLPNSAALRSLLKWHKQRLGMLLKESLGSIALRHISMKFIAWPLVVFGMKANAEDRKFVKEELAHIAYDIGSYLPMLAGSVLSEFWRSEATGWDDCFQTPFIFINT